MISKILKIFFLILILFSSVIHAQTIPLDGLRLNVKPRHQEEAGEDVGPKSVSINNTATGLKISWYSLVKDLDKEAVYPTIKIKSRRGVIETDGFVSKAAVFLPGLWGNGFIRTETALPLWLDPTYLQLQGRDRRQFDLGLLRRNDYLGKMVPEDLGSQLDYFQNLYDQYVQGDDLRDGTRLSRTAEKDLRRFVKEFSFVQMIAKTKAQIFTNNIKEEYPAKIIGNDYFQFVVLDDPVNPLIINFSINDKKIPEVFEKVFKNFKNNMDYSVTSIAF